MLVVITIGLISTAYLYFTSIVSVGPVLSIANAYCDNSKNIYVTLKNDGTASINTTTSVTWIVNGNQRTLTSTCSPEKLDAANTASCTISASLGVNSGVNNILAIGPKNQAGGPVTCP
jgi:hypothetical protein